MKNRFTKMFAVLTAVLMLLCILPAGVFAEGEDIPIDEAHSPDANFNTKTAAETRVDMPTREGVGMSIAGFNTEDLDGNPVTDEILQNADVTIINYWSTWYGPCMGELPYFEAVADHFEETPEVDVQIIGVISEFGGCTPASAKQALADAGCHYLNLRADSVLNAVFNTSCYIPQTIVVDRTGTVRDNVIGVFPSAAGLQEFIEMWYDVIANHADDMATITYVCEPTGETIDTIEVPYGTPVPEGTPQPPEIAGHTFLKWEYSGGIYESGYEDITYLVMGDITATATYKVVKYKVKFYDGVTGQILRMQQVEYGNAATAPEHPGHEGYEFTGWDTDFSCVTENLDVHGICVPTGETPPTEEPPTEVIGFYFETDPAEEYWYFEDEDGDGYNWEWYYDVEGMSVPEGLGMMNSQSYDNNTWAALTPDNWLISPVVPGGGSVSFMYVAQDPSYSNENFGVYASTDGGDTWGEELGYFTSTGAVQTGTVDLTAYADMNIQLAFRHYNTINQFSLNLDAVEVVPSGSGEAPDYTVTFVDGYTGEEIPGGYSVEAGAVLDPEDFPQPPEHYGYHFTDWDYDGSPICEDTEITAQYEINTYYVHFVDSLTGEELCDVQEVRHGDYIEEFPAVPEHEGYRFAQWYNGTFGNDAGSNPIKGNYDGESIFIYAAYDYEITFCDWNGIPFATEYVYWDRSSTYIYPPAAPEHNGYTFTGWSPEFENPHYYYYGPKTYIAQYGEFAHPEDPDIIFRTNTVYTKPDTDVTIDFTLEALKPYECHAFTGFLYYEPSELTLIDNELVKGEVWRQIEELGGMVAVDTSVYGKIGLTVIMPSAGFDMSGIIFSMNFHVENYHDWQGYSSPLFIEITECSNHPVGGEETPIVYDIENGSVNIYDMTFGDVNWDGKIDTTDVILIMRYTLGVQTLTGKYLAAADFNHDGVIDATDALLIMRYIMN